MYNGKENIIILLDAGGEIREIDLNAFRKDRISFGRFTSNDIVINSSIASRLHGYFEFSDGRLFVYDNGSTNGLFVNNRLYKTDGNGAADVHLLKNGDIIRIDGSDRSKKVLMLYRTSKSSGIWNKVPAPHDRRLTIGRLEQCDVHLPSPSVSRHHASVGFDENGRLFIEDMASTNGVFVNGLRIVGRRPLRDKDIITISNSFIFVSDGNLLYKSIADGTRVVMRNISRTVKVGGEDKYILQDVNLTVEPNEFIAIIGGSGAGKSTVMNAMSGFERATSGEVYVNDTDLYKNYHVLKNIIGYVPQQDIIYENISLYKMLEYSAKMRMSEDTSPEEREKRIREVLKMVELEEHQDKFIRSLSGGQKKRASIAVELLADPGLFFLDEPTSGLDPGTEASLMRTLNHLSKHGGKTIVMVTHTTQNLHLCDKVLLMGKGGRVCFYGSPQECKDFFGVDSLTEVYNKVLTDEEVARCCSRYAHMYGYGSERSRPVQSGKTPSPRKASFMRQFGILSMRYMTLIKNDYQRLLMIFLQPVIIAILLSLVADDKVFEVYNSTKSIMFATSCAGIWVGLFSSIQEVCKERNILKREYMANLRLGAYVLSKFSVQFLLSAIQAFIMIGMFVVIVGSPDSGVKLGSAFFEMFVTMLLTIFTSSALGIVVSSISKNSDKAMTTAPFLLIIQLLFSGILFELKGFTEKISYITVSRWSVSSFGTIANLNSLEMAIPMMPHDPEMIYDYRFMTVASAWAILAGFVIICFILSVILLRNVSKDSR